MIKNFTKTLLLGLCIFASAEGIRAAEELLWNEVVTYTTSSSSGFYFNYDISPFPSNMISPSNFRDGQMYIRYEVISQPTNPSGGYTPIYFQWNIWGDWAPPSWTETASGFSSALNGPGSVVTYNDSPSNWWTKNGGVDWYNTSTFDHHGLVARVNMEGSLVLLSPEGYSSNPLSHEAWAMRADHWFPMEVRISVVTVSSGSSFSGWENYDLTGGGGGTCDPEEVYAFSDPAENRIQAEDMTLNSYFEQTYTNASGGSVAGLWNDATSSGNPSGSITANFPHASGSYDVEIVYLDENDGASPFTFKVGATTIGSWTGVEQECRNKYTKKTYSGVAINNGDLITIEGENSTGAWAKVDYIDFISVTPPDPCAGFLNSSPTASGNAIEGEDMTMNDYHIQSLPGASGGSAASLWSSVGTFESGTISTFFPHTSAVYDIKVVTIDEDDGSSPFNLKLNGSSLASWNGINRDCQDEYVTRTISDVTIYNGDLISIDGGQSDEAYAKIDYIDFIYKDAVPIEYPEFTIDYFNEQTVEIMTADYQYSYNQSTWNTGPGTYLSLTPGQDVYIRVSGVAESQVMLDVPARGSAPGFTIDYINETTTETVSSAYQYSSQANMSGATLGTGAKVGLVPGQDMYFRRYATNESFRSNIQSLDVPARPAAPSFSISYVAEATSSVIPSNVRYATTSNMSGATAGTGSVLAVSPGVDMYFQYQASAGVFASEVQHLDVPARPAGPVFTIDFENEATAEAAPATVQYSNSESMSGAITGSANPIALQPLTNYYFREIPKINQFSSAITSLITPSRPGFASSYVADTTSSDVIDLRLLNDSGIEGFELSDLQLTNCTAGNLGTINDFEIYPTDFGMVYVSLPANTLTGGNFASSEYSIEYINNSSSTIDVISHKQQSLFNVYPSPAKNFITLEWINADLATEANIEIYNMLGVQVNQEKLSSVKSTIPVADLQKGIYIIMVKNASTGLLISSERFVKD